MSSKQKLLIICGPTGVGKTSLGVELAKKLSGEIVSADSRQIYRKMDIATGKDLSQLKGVPVHLVDIAYPDENFSVAQYYKLATQAIRDIKKRGNLPIIVGGTGFYIKALVDGLDTIGIAPNKALRDQYRNKSAEELLMILARLDPELAHSLNKSEQYNKQRLIRRIEIAQLGGTITKDNSDEDSDYETFLVGLMAPDQLLKERINARIDSWIKEGAEEEVKTLLEEGSAWDSQAMTALGYRQWQAYFEGKMSREEAISLWKTEEYQYAKRQLTWFKKDTRIKWFDTRESDWRQKVDKAVADWYHVEYAKNN